MTAGRDRRPVRTLGLVSGIPAADRTETKE